VYGFSTRAWVVTRSCRSTMVGAHLTARHIPHQSTVPSAAIIRSAHLEAPAIHNHPVPTAATALVAAAILPAGAEEDLRVRLLLPRTEDLRGSRGWLTGHH